MSKEYNIKPKLRFSEFAKTMDWGLKELGELSDVIKGVQLNKIELIPTGNYPCLNGGIFPSGYTNKFNTEENTITISEGGNSCGYVNFMITKFWLGGHCYKLIPLNKVDNLFLFHLLKFNEGRIMRLRVGSGLPNIQQKALRSIQLQFTYNKQEQQKIAACLSSLDDLITAENKKLETLKAHKNGLLQNLFPADGETVPKLRFKEFEGSGEWVEKRLDEVAEFLKGKGISKADINNQGKLPCIRYGELYTHYKEIIEEIQSYTNLPTDELFLSEENDVIIPSSGETKEDIATASCVKLKGIALGGDLNILRSQIDGEFLAYYLSHGLKKSISKIAQGDAVVHLYATQLKKLLLRVPPKKEEQQQIASTLSSLDKRVTIQTQKIEILNLHKKGLMQGLFPDTTEITA